MSKEVLSSEPKADICDGSSSAQAVDVYSLTDHVSPIPCLDSAIVRDETIAAKEVGEHPKTDCRIGMS